MTKARKIQVKKKRFKDKLFQTEKNSNRLKIYFIKQYKKLKKNTGKIFQ